MLLDWYSGTPPYTVSPLEGHPRQARRRTSTVNFAADNTNGAAVELARAADVAIVIVGNHPTCNAGWEKTLLPSDGKEAVDRQVHHAGAGGADQAGLQPPTRAPIVVLISSFPFAINWTQENVPAILHMTHNSQETGNALADVLFGDYNPAGRLVQTWPESLDQLPPMMDYNITPRPDLHVLQGRTAVPVRLRPELHDVCVLGPADGGRLASTPDGTVNLRWT